MCSPDSPQVGRRPRLRVGIADAVPKLLVRTLLAPALAAFAAEAPVLLDVAVDEDAASDLRVFINPDLVELVGTTSFNEGCLSFPGAREDINRAEKVRVRALNLQGETFEFDAEGLLAVCVQHELDHLEGKVFVEYLSLLKQNRIKSKLAKKARITA